MSLIQLTLFLLARILILVQSLAALMKSNAPFGDSVLSLPNPFYPWPVSRSFSPFACYFLIKNGIWSGKFVRYLYLT